MPMDHNFYCDECGRLAHAGIRCPTSGRCGRCGATWPCKAHERLVPPKQRVRVASKRYVKE